MNYFASYAPQTAEELKKAWKDLYITHHPDNGGNLLAMQMINAQFDALHARLKDVHYNLKGDIYASKRKTNESPAEWRSMMEGLLKKEGVIVEIIGSFVWVSGDTKPIKETLKSYKFKWHTKKFNWYLSPDNYYRRSRKDFTMDDIRNKFGSEQIELSEALEMFDKAIMSA